MQSESVSVFAPAKVNLFLHVTNRRDDGYHELESLVMFADIGDRVSAAHGNDFSLEIAGAQAAGLAADNDNLVVRAALALAERIGAAAGAAMTLEKNLPVSSGIGGGSADAAATIKALVRLWEIHPGQHDLSGLALDLGADVPVCLAGRATMMSGIGEVLEPIDDLPDLPAVLVNPGVAVATPAVFKARTAQFSPKQEDMTWSGDIRSCVEHIAEQRNDLTEAAVSIAPAIGDVLAALAQTDSCLLSRMSGSGATCFGLYADTAAAEAAAQDLQKRRPEWWVASTVLQGAN